MELNLKNSTSTSNTVETPIAVFKDVYNADYSSPGYRLDQSGDLVFSQNVTESHAWQNPVFVIGIAEPDAPHFQGIDDFYSGGVGGGGSSGGGNTTTLRNEGHQEFGGIFQITNLNAIEHWTAGKIELTIIVVSASGVVVKDKDYPKRKRSNYTNSRWVDKQEFLYFWNTPVIGAFTVEKWIERDGGQSAEVTVTVPAACQGCPTTAFKFPSESLDDDLGQSIVQFTDPLQTVYGISNFNFKRK